MSLSPQTHPKHRRSIVSRRFSGVSGLVTTALSIPIHPDEFFQIRK